MQLRRMLETTQQRLQESALKEQEASKAETDLKSLQRQMEDALQVGF